VAVDNLSRPRRPERHAGVTDAVAPRDGVGAGAFFKTPRATRLTTVLHTTVFDTPATMSPALSTAVVTHAVVILAFVRSIRSVGPVDRID